MSGLRFSLKNRRYREPLIPLVTVATVGKYPTQATVSTVNNGTNGCFIPTVHLHFTSLLVNVPKIEAVNKLNFEPIDFAALKFEVSRNFGCPAVG